MTLRLAFKINSSNLFKNFGKFFYTRKAIEPDPAVQNHNEASKIQTKSEENVGMSPQVYLYAIPKIIRHTPASESERHDTEAKILQHNIAQQLQPAMLPRYYQSAINDEDDVFSKAPEGSHYRQFEKSLTYKNVKLPLKKSKLASPFPDPVEIMPSDTVSDREKAEQMQATSTKSVQTSGSTQFRHYSTKSRKDSACPKKKCEKHNPKQCPPRARKYCVKPYPDLGCKKQEAPYPSYSESCHTVLDEKPSECKLCPWKPRKPRKKK